MLAPAAHGVKTRYTGERRRTGRRRSHTAVDADARRFVEHNAAVRQILPRTSRTPVHRFALAGMLAIAFACTSVRSPARAPFVVEETTIADIHRAMAAGSLTCRALVGRYLARIAAYD